MDHLNVVEPGCVSTITGGYVFIPRHHRATCTFIFIFIFPLFLFSNNNKKNPLSRYRRGKPESNDIDIVFTHPNAKSAKNLCGRLVERLQSAGLVTHIMCEYRPT